MEKAIRILHLEDNPSDSQLVQSALKRANISFEYFLVDNEEDYVYTLGVQKIDVILSDYHLPDYSGSEALLYAKNNYPHLPFVFLSGTMGEDAAIESLLNGATDYVLKNRMGRLVSALQRAFNESQEHKARQEAEKALLQSEENFRRSISESPLGIRIVSVEGNTVYANKAFLDIYEFNTLEEYTGTPAKDRYTPESYLQHQERKEKRANGQYIYNYELSIIRKNGEIRHVKVASKEILWNGIKHYQIINQDITEQKKLTADLIAAKNKAEEGERLKTAFLANMSHEIRTPMNGILGFAELLKEPNLSGHEQQEYIRIIEKSGARMLNIINDIVDISKIEAGLTEIHIEESNINEQIEYIYDFFKPEIESKGIKFFFRNGLSAKESVIKTDREKMFAILTNLVKNAIKYSFGGTIEFGYIPIGMTGQENEGAQNTVEVHGRASLQRPVSLQHPMSLQHPAFLQFYVKDCGIGIPKDRQDAIFERFVQADIGDKRAFQGAGLGLSITKAYVEMLGGKIWVDSEEGKGSIFYFTVPYNIERHEMARDVNVSVEDTPHYIKPLKILIAEDDEGSARLISLIVRKFSKEILYAVTGVEAVEVCRNNPDIDLVLMDIKMPVMDGYEASRQIRQFNTDVVIVAQTAYALLGDREKTIGAGCNDYLSKPVKKDQLLELMKKYF
jgi:PAS domain S-box-containing protein